jgi:hypothetical protein
MEKDVFNFQVLEKSTRRETQLTLLSIPLKCLPEHLDDAIFLIAPSGKGS